MELKSTMSRIILKKICKPSQHIKWKNKMANKYNLCLWKTRRRKTRSALFKNKRGILQVVFGKHSFANVNINNGKTKFIGSD